MARVSATASLGIRLGLGGKKGYQSHDAASPHHSITLDREVSDDLTDEQLMERTMELHAQAEKRVQNLIAMEIRRVREMA